MSLNWYYILLLSFSFLNAQKIVKKSILNNTISSIQINSHNCFKVNISTATVNEITVEAEIEGEYTKDLLLTAKEEGNTLVVGASLQPNFINPNDKLSIHKIISISLNIILPKYKKVQLYGSSSNVFVAGEYRNLKITLRDGLCVLKNVGGVAEVTLKVGILKLLVLMRLFLPVLDMEKYIGLIYLKGKQILYSVL